MAPKEEEVPAFMQGKSKLELKAEKAAAKAARKAAKDPKGSGGGANGDLPHSMSEMSLASNVSDVTFSLRTVTGVLASRPTARDIKITGYTMGLNGIELIKECTIELTIGRRYGLIGQNGSGKTNFLQCIANREVPIPDHLDIYHLHQEAEPSEMSALEAVIDHIRKELANLHKQARAAELLHGLGFSRAMMERKTKDMSGGWRMRVALARALFAAPTLLLLDEPTNHLDLEACVWLEQYLSQYKKCLIIVSHSQDFLNGVCTHIIWLTRQTLTYYSGNYDTFRKTVAENEVVQLKKFQKEQDDIKHIKEFIASCGTYANLVKQAKSKQKMLIDQVAKEIWVCENKTVAPWKGNIRDYKKMLAKRMGVEH
ncbi:flagellar associated protein [Raphidocelis subcapitata]|uniref:Flagellar associated protein n=1 Tax=Raphidocelis subcapitata TaxID=307507 RepID=A0A2V0P9W1_9CHLO|nr:flagellar associated protein [Raphidocelis subcapitata]|eukprot:GBF96634.1 flagellar associated protein [Raphidocelis subcapitata]